MYCVTFRLSNNFFIFLPPSQLSAIAFGVTFGLLWLSTVPPTNGLVGHIFGTKHLGLLYGIVFVSHQIGSFLGAYLGGVFYEMYGNVFDNDLGFSVRDRNINASRISKLAKKLSE